MNLLARPKGFTMIEILVAMVILTISLLAVAGLMAKTTRNNSFGCYMTEAATFAQDKLEELRIAPWASIANGNDMKTGSTGMNYARNWSVVANATNLRTITIAINWVDQSNRSIRFVSAVVQ